MGFRCFCISMVLMNPVPASDFCGWMFHRTCDRLYCRLEIPCYLRVNKILHIWSLFHFRIIVIFSSNILLVYFYATDQSIRFPIRILVVLHKSKLEKSLNIPLSMLEPDHLGSSRWPDLLSTFPLWWRW